MKFIRDYNLVFIFLKFNSEERLRECANHLPHDDFIYTVHTIFCRPNTGSMREKIARLATEELMIHFDGKIQDIYNFPRYRDMHIEEQGNVLNIPLSETVRDMMADLLNYGKDFIMDNYYTRI